ncbi:MAG: MFS transporter [Elusimicrobia bacterium]|nr:MFS transporter [Elusimicrobiota bacterium]
MEPSKISKPKVKWLNRTVIGIGLASLFSDWSHEVATAVMPAYLASIGVAAAWLGLIEGVADGLSSFAKMGSGYYTDRLRRRKPIAVAGYVLTAVGTAAFSLASQAWHLLIARSFAWFGRGVRTPIRNALLAGSVEKEAYGRAFGFDRMMDTFGAILGPASAFFILKILNNNYSKLFFLTLIPGMVAALAIQFLVQEKDRMPVPHISFGESLKALPKSFRGFLFAVGLFGIGDFSHTLLILFASEKLASSMGMSHAGSIAVGLYLLRNFFYASCSYLFGWAADRFSKRKLLASGYYLAAVMSLCMIWSTPTLFALTLIFIVGGIYIAIEETLEDSFCAELVTKEQHGMAFGVLATVNGLGDFLSSIVVGFLWTRFGTAAAFSYSFILFIAGATLILRINRGSEKNLND